VIAAVSFSRFVPNTI